MICKPTVSIIIPIYNVQNYIERCVRSIQSQTLKEIEIILVNDGSTDESQRIIEKLKEKDSRIVLINQENCGLSASRNRGLDIAKGKYILFVDGDDFIEDKGCLECLFKVAENNEIEVVLFPYKKIYSSEEIIAKLPIQKTGMIKDVKNEVFRKLIGPDANEIFNIEEIDRLNTAWGKLYRRDVVDKIRFLDTKLIGVEDGWFNILVFKNIKRAWYETQVYYCYEKRNSSSLLHNYNENFYLLRKNAYSYMYDFLESNNLKDWNICLQNRIAVEVIGLILKISKSDLSFYKKNIELNRILSDDIYSKAIKDLNIKFASNKVRGLFILCRHKLTFVIISVVNIYLRYRERK